MKKVNCIIGSALISFSTFGSVELERELLDKKVLIETRRPNFVRTVDCKNPEHDNKLAYMYQLESIEESAKDLSLKFKVAASKCKNGKHVRKKIKLTSFDIHPINIYSPLVALPSALFTAIPAGIVGSLVGGYQPEYDIENQQGILELNVDIDKTKLVRKVIKKDKTLTFNVSFPISGIPVLLARYATVSYGFSLDNQTKKLHINY
jgi:hypothetical protein